jgi:hypothetical protein
MAALLVIAMLGFGSVGALAASGHVSAAGRAHHHVKKAKKNKHHAKVRHVRHSTGVAVRLAASRPTGTPAAAPVQGSGRSAAAQEYGTRPGKGCGDKNHTHTGPPGNPGNKDCPH